MQPKVKKLFQIHTERDSRSVCCNVRELADSHSLQPMNGYFKSFSLSKVNEATQQQWVWAVFKRPREKAYVGCRALLNLTSKMSEHLDILEAFVHHSKVRDYRWLAKGLGVTIWNAYHGGSAYTVEFSNDKDLGECQTLCIGDHVPKKWRVSNTLSQKKCSSFICQSPQHPFNGGHTMILKGDLR